MMDYLDLGPTPVEEGCEQVGTPSYDPILARAECAAYIAQLKREFGPPPEGARLSISTNPHDFGTYHEVVVRFDDTFLQAVEYAFKLESESPGNWDETARKELGL